MCAFCRFFALARSLSLVWTYVWNRKNNWESEFQVHNNKWRIEEKKCAIGSMCYLSATTQQSNKCLQRYFCNREKKWKKLLAGFGKIQLNLIYFRCFEAFSLCFIRCVTFSCGHMCAANTMCLPFSFARSLTHTAPVAMLVLSLPRSNSLFWRLIRTESSDRQMAHNLKAPTTRFSSFGVARKLIPLRLIKTIHFC